MKYSLSFLIFCLSLFCLFQFNQKTFSKEEVAQTESPAIEEESTDAKNLVRKSKETSPVNGNLSQESKELNQVIENLNAIDDCLQKENCYKQTDPKAHEAHALNDIIKNLRYLRKNQYKNMKGEKLKRLSKKYLRYNHDLVKLEALQMMEANNLGEEDVNYIFKQVFSEPNPHSISYSMKLFGQQTNPGIKDSINKNLYQVMTRGGIYPALEVVQNMDSLLNESNRNYFEQALYEIEKQKISKRLHSELKKKLEL